VVCVGGGGVVEKWDVMLGDEEVEVFDAVGVYSRDGDLLFLRGCGRPRLPGST
jgi:hypothetical protein